MRFSIPVMAFLLTFSLYATAEDVRVEKVISVYDADTFRVDIAGWPDIVGKNMSVRVNGVDAAEIRGKCEGEKQLARQARDFTRQFLANGQVIELRNIQRGKYFRLLADVYVDGNSLTDALLLSGLARPYDGGSRQGWC
ncbi:thermonuclease family protein [Maribrevibacterium harenarium]|uniref:Thermonuclease family protein n=1 Tax=Maribrevibacterium harenarium TaxID=2589817 RepID=A0A501W884_9GAMM|nr:thermonuclease family protein [Maribrevibacterium harenarium]TPE44580.1 thermonuclease family protein [Maribrevibacterium harenarium]